MKKENVFFALNLLSLRDSKILSDRGGSIGHYMYCIITILFNFLSTSIFFYCKLRPNITFNPPRNQIFNIVDTTKNAENACFFSIFQP